MRGEAAGRVVHRRLVLGYRVRRRWTWTHRGHGTAHEQFTSAGIPRDGGLADLLAEARSPSARFAAVMCEDIERSGRDTFNALRLEKELSAAGVPLFATDEPIDVAGMNATTVLIRRVKQGVAEWYRLQTKEKAWKGLREHALDGWNIGAPPYGYTAERVPHPVAVKAAQGATKTRLVLDPVPAAAVAQIFTWRAVHKLGVSTIANRLNADHEAYPPPRGDTWTEQGVYTLLGNPKYTGHMVWNRRTKKGSRRHPNPPAEWIWSPQPAHPVIITRDLYDAAQRISLVRAASTGEPGQPGHPLARRSYEFRSLVRHRACKRRMGGTIRASGIYYLCPHDVNNPRHAAACPDHPRTVTLREDHLANVVAQFIEERLTGPDRAALFAAQLPANDADQAARREKEAAALGKTLHRIETAQDALIRELETLDPAVPAARAMRDRIRARFAQLEDERTATRAQLDDLTAHEAPRTDPGLLETLPHLPGRLADLPPATRSKLYQALGIEILYKHDMHQVTCRAVLTTSTPDTVTAIISDTSSPAPASQDTCWDSTQPTPVGPSLTAVESGAPGPDGGTSGEVERELDAVQHVRAGTGPLRRQARDDVQDQVAEPGHIRGEHAEHFLLGDSLPLLHARVGVGDEGQRRVAQRQFPGQHGLGVPGHPDQAPALGGVPLGFCAGGEAGPLDDDERAGVGQVPAGRAGRRDGLGPPRRAVGVGERDVHGAAGVVEGLGAPDRAVHDLIGDGQPPRPVGGIQGADRGRGQDLPDPQRAQRPQVGPVRDPVRRVPVVPAVPGHERHRPAGHLTDHDGIAGLPVGGVHLDLVGRLEELVEAGPADDTDLRARVHADRLATRRGGRGRRGRTLRFLLGPGRTRRLRPGPRRSRPGPRRPGPG